MTFGDLNGHAYFITQNFSTFIHINFRDIWDWNGHTRFVKMSGLTFVLKQLYELTNFNVDTFKHVFLRWIKSLAFLLCIEVQISQVFFQTTLRGRSRMAGAIVLWSDHPGYSYSAATHFGGVTDWYQSLGCRELGCIFYPKL